MLQQWVILVFCGKPLLRTIQSKLKTPLSIECYFVFKNGKDKHWGDQFLDSRTRWLNNMSLTLLINHIQLCFMIVWMIWNSGLFEFEIWGCGGVVVVLVSGAGGRVTCTFLKWSVMMSSWGISGKGHLRICREIIRCLCGVAVVNALFLIPQIIYFRFLDLDQVMAY